MVERRARSKGKSDSGSVKRAPLFWRGQGDSHAARAAGWYPAPAHIPNSGRWNWFHDGLRLRVFPRERERFGGAQCLLLCGGAPHTPQPPRGATPARTLKIKRCERPRPVFPLTGRGLSPASLAEYTRNRAQHERDCAREQQAFVEEFDHDSPPSVERVPPRKPQRQAGLLVPSVGRSKPPLYRNVYLFFWTNQRRKS